MASEVELQNLETPKTENGNGATTSAPVLTTNPEVADKFRSSKFLLIFIGIVGLILVTCLLTIFNQTSSFACETVLSYDFDPSCGNARKCNIAAQRILHSLNTSVDPCDNFYEFACGGWKSKNPVPDYLETLGSLHERLTERNQKFINILQKFHNEAQDEPLSMAKNYFQKCVTTWEQHNNSDKQAEDKQFIWDKLEQFGGWPILYPENTWNSSRFDWIKSVIALKKEFRATWLFTVEIDSSNVVSILSPSQAGVPPLFDAKDKSAREAYKQYIVNMVKELSAFSGNVTLNEDDLHEKVEQILLTTMRFQELQSFSLVHNLEMIISFSQPPTLESLQQNMKQWKIGVDLLGLLNQVYDGTGMVAHKNQPAKLSMIYFQELFDAVSKAGPEAMANFLHFQMARRLVPLSSLRNLQSLADKIHREENGSKPKAQVELDCIFRTSGFFRKALIPEFIKHGQFELGNFTKVTTMFENIKGTIWNMMYKSRSLESNETKNSESVCKTKFCAGEEVSNLNSYYGGIPWNNSMSFLEQNMVLNLWKANEDLKRVQLPEDKECPWSKISSVADMAPLFLPTSTGNIVYADFKDLLTPFYHDTLPRSLIYGRLGFALGHEIAHGVKGMKLDSMSCIRNQYWGFYHSHATASNISVDGSNTLVENFADNLAMHAVYQTYLAIPNNGAKHGIKGLENYSNEQLFFIGFAQSFCSAETPGGYQKRYLQSANHAPDDVRVLGTLQNFDKFSNVWNCPIGSNMNPGPTQDVKTCKVL